MIKAVIFSKFWLNLSEDILVNVRYYFCLTIVHPIGIIETLFLLLLVTLGDVQCVQD